jgi:hypothetical protein
VIRAKLWVVSVATRLARPGEIASEVHRQQSTTVIFDFISTLIDY